jgi:hypothetical protein
MVSILSKNKFLLIFITFSATHPASYPMGTGGSFLVVKAAEA